MSGHRVTALAGAEGLTDTGPLSWQGVVGPHGHRAARGWGLVGHRATGLAGGGGLVEYMTTMLAGRHIGSQGHRAGKEACRTQDHWAGREACRTRGHRASPTNVSTFISLIIYANGELPAYVLLLLMALYTKACLNIHVAMCYVKEKPFRTTVNFVLEEYGHRSP